MDDPGSGGRRRPIRLPGAGLKRGDLVYVPSLPTLPPRLLWPGRRAPDGARLDAAAGLFAYARDALQAGLRAIGLRAGDAVLVPAYTCEAVLAPMVEQGLRILYYGLNEDLTPRDGDVRLGFGSARALYLIDYFGVCAPPAALVEEARSRGLLIVRDMAHRLYGNPEEPLPEADLAIWSLRKFYPVPDGGVLRLAGSAGRPAAGAPPSLGVGAAGRLIVKNAALRSGVRIGPRRRRAPEARGSLQGDNWRITGRSISLITLFLMKRLSPAAILQARRGNFRAVARRLAARTGTLRLVYGDLPPGACPYACPLLAERRDDLQAALQAVGILPEATFRNCPYLPPGAREVRPGVLAEAAALADRILSLPVLQEMSPRDVARMADLVERWRA